MSSATHLCRGTSAPRREPAGRDALDARATKALTAAKSWEVSDVDSPTRAARSIEKRESEERLPRDEWLAKALLGGKFDSYKKAPPPPAKKGWSLRQLGRFRVKREAS